MGPYNKRQISRSAFECIQCKFYIQERFQDLRPKEIGLLGLMKNREVLLNKGNDRMPMTWEGTETDLFVHTLLPAL